MTKLLPEPEIRMCCATCGGENVKRDAWAEWNVELQMWELGQFFDHAACDDCGGETRILECPNVSNPSECNRAL